MDNGSASMPCQEASTMRLVAIPIWNPPEMFCERCPLMAQGQWLA